MLLFALMRQEQAEPLLTETLTQCYKARLAERIEFREHA